MLWITSHSVGWEVGEQYVVQPSTLELRHCLSGHVRQDQESDMTWLKKQEEDGPVPRFKDYNGWIVNHMVKNNFDITKQVCWSIPSASATWRSQIWCLTWRRRVRLHRPGGSHWSHAQAETLGSHDPCQKSYVLAKQIIISCLSNGSKQEGCAWLSLIYSGGRHAKDPLWAIT